MFIVREQFFILKDIYKLCKLDFLVCMELIGSDIDSFACMMGSNPQ